MAFLARGKKRDLIELAEVLDIEIGENLKILEIRDAIIGSPTYDAEFTKECLNRIVEDRKEVEQSAQRERESERLFELEKLKLRSNINSSRTEPETVSSSVDADMPKLELNKLVPNFDPKTSDMSLFLDLFEKQLTFLKVPASKWVVYLVGLLPTDVANLIVKESADDAQNYEKIKQVLLRRFKLSAEKFRQLFAQHRKNPENTWRDFYFDIRNYFDGWLKGLNVSTFEELKDLMLSDQIKKKVPPEYKEHFLDQWSELSDPLKLADKLDLYEETKQTRNRCVSKEPPKCYQRNVPEGYKNISQNFKGVTSRNTRRNEDRPVVSCYGCGKPGFIKAKCPECSPTPRKEAANFKNIQLQTFSIKEPQPILLKVKIKGLNGIVCADTGASHNVAGETLFRLLRERGAKFQKTIMNVTLADGIKREMEVYMTEVEIEIEGRTFCITLCALPSAKDNRTLLGADFLRSAGIILDLSRDGWYYRDNPGKRFKFSVDDFRPSDRSEDAVDVYTFQLRDNEGEHLSKEQRTKLNELLNHYVDVLQPGEEPTSKVLHYIDTGDNPPVAVPPYRMSPPKKKFVEKVQENKISDNEEILIKKNKSSDFDKDMLNPKKLHLEKKKAIHAINELRDILGVTKSRDPKEEELEEFIFGCDADELLNESSESQSEEEKEEEKVTIKPAWEDEEDDKILVEEKANVVADMLSRPFCQHLDETCEICTVTMDLPTRNPREIREEQLRDQDVKKIIQSLESLDKDENFANWNERGYLMNQGVLYRYSPDADTEEAQLVVPLQERERVLKEHHDVPSAGHYGVEGTCERIAKRYYWTGMRRYISEYIKNCPDCCRYKPSNQKPSGLLQTPIYGQRFETLSIDLFGPLPKSNEKRWVFIIEDCATKWVELFALATATAKECAITLIEEVFLRYGLPRRVISDNGLQFVSSVMQQVCFLLKIKQTLTPYYHPQANPVERKNRDLKPRLAMLVGNNHTTWSEKLPIIRFALNSAKCSSTGETAAYLMFGRELRTIDDIAHDFKSIVENDNFVPEITPYLKKFANLIEQIRDRIEESQNRHKHYADKRFQKAPHFKPGDKVWVTAHPISSSAKNQSSKFMPRRDGPYTILSQRSPVSYTLASTDNPSSPIGNYHVSALRPCNTNDTSPIRPLRGRGRPKGSPSVKKRTKGVTKVSRKPDRPTIPRRIQPTRQASCIARTQYTA